MTRAIFFPLAHDGPLPDEIAALLDNASVYMTARDDDALARARQALPSGASYAGGAVTRGPALADIAPAAVECAELLGGVDGLIFAPPLSSKERLFLDISPEDFAAHAGAINIFFNACKCALPYMMGRIEPLVAVCLPASPANLTERMYHAAMESLISDIEAELGQWGVRVEKFYV